MVWFGGFIHYILLNKQKNLELTSACWSYWMNTWKCILWQRIFWIPNSVTYIGHFYKPLQRLHVIFNQGLRSQTLPFIWPFQNQMRFLILTVGRADLQMKSHSSPTHLSLDVKLRYITFILCIMRLPKLTLQTCQMSQCLINRKGQVRALLITRLGSSEWVLKKFGKLRANWDNRAQKRKVHWGCEDEEDWASE